MQSGPLGLAHGWTLSRGSSVPRVLVREFIRPAVRAVPSGLARRLGSCRISFPAETAADVASRWTITDTLGLQQWRSPRCLQPQLSGVAVPWRAGWG